MIVILFVAGMFMAYQTTTPCDDACFKRKMEQTSKESSPPKKYKKDLRYDI